MPQKLLPIRAATSGALLLAWLGFTERAAAQDLSIPAAPRRLEIGIFRQDHHRTFRYTDGFEQDAKFDRIAFSVRARVAPDLALEAEGGTRHIGATPQFPARDYVDYSVGAGVTATPFRVAGVQLGASVHYWRLAAVDQSPSRYDKLQRQWSVAIGGARTLRLGGQSLTLWAGPAYVVDWIDQLPPAAAPSHARSVQNLGGVAGGSVTLAGHLRLSGRITFLNEVQTQVGAALLL